MHLFALFPLALDVAFPLPILLVLSSGSLLPFRTAAIPRMTRHLDPICSERGGAAGGASRPGSQLRALASLGSARLWTVIARNAGS